MYQFRPFSNADPPALAEIWQSQPPQRGLMQPVSPALLDYLVFAKPYFDPAGLIVAIRDERPVGFVHAAFGPNEDETALSTESGTIQMLMVAERERNSSLAAELVEQAEQYLRARGTRLFYAGGIRPLNAFYLGLYGGSELPGILVADPASQVVREAGYQAISSVTILQRNLASFRPIISHRLRTIRREFRCDEVSTPAPGSWWDACTMGWFDDARFQAVRCADEEPVATMRVWDVEPIASSWGLRTVGLTEIAVASEFRRIGLATWMVGEVLGMLQKLGVALVEVQTMQDNFAALGLYEKLGFTAVDSGTVYRKP